MELVREFGRQLLESVACVSIILSFCWPSLFCLFLTNLADFLFWLSCEGANFTRFFNICLLYFNVDMHDLRLIHTDLKPENILLVSSEYVKVPNNKVFVSCIFVEIMQFFTLRRLSSLKCLGWYRKTYWMRCTSGACQSQVP